MKAFRLWLAACALVSAFVPQTATQAADDVKIALGWLRNGQYAPLMVADAKGYFAEHGIKATFIDGGPGKNPVPLVGVGGAASVITARLAKDPIDVVAIGALNQNFPYAYITLGNPGDPDPKPKDLEGKTVGMQSDGRYLLEAMAKKNGLDLSKIKVETVLANAEPLLIGKVDYFTGMLNNQTYQVELEAAKPNAPANLKGKVWKVIKFADYGVPFYHDVLYTTGSKIKNNPDLVRRFLSAVAKGVKYTVENPDDAVKLVATYPEQVEDAGKLAWRMKIQNPLAVSADTQRQGILWMDPSVWDAGMAFYKEYDQIPRVIPAAEVMTNEFNPKITSK